MKRALLVSLCILSGCDWQAAENKARCTAGELSFCTDAGPSGGGLGGGTGGGSGGDGGIVDAGRIDLMVQSGNTPFSLEEGPNGMIWVITSSGTATYLSQFKAGALSLAGSFNSDVTATFADPLISPVILVAAANATAGIGFTDGDAGMSVPLPAPAAIAIQVPEPDGGLRASFWLNTPNEYRQVGSVIPLTTPTNVVPPVACTGLQLHDVALVLGDAGCCGAIGYSGSCNGGDATGINGGSGVQIVPVGVPPFGIQLDSAATRVMVGRSAQGFDAANQTSAGAIAFWRYNASATQTNSFAVTPTVGLLTLGDVSDGFVSFQATGNFTVRDVPVNTGVRAAWVAELETKRIIQVGPATATARMPILALPGRVLVLWKRDDGRVVLTQFSR